MIEIDEGLTIPERELSFTASRSAGPGGQHVNKVSSRVTLRWHVRDSPSLTDEQRRRILTRLVTRITKDGVLQMHCQKQRSQAANRLEVRGRFADLVRQALRRQRPRRPTRRTRAAEERRLETKRRRARLKRLRSRSDRERD